MDQLHAMLHQRVDEHGEVRKIASPEDLAEFCECDRDVYVDGEENLKRVFSPAAVLEGTSREYADGQKKYSIGKLSVGESAPDCIIHCLGKGNTEIQLLAALPETGYLVLDFGSFS